MDPQACIQRILDSDNNKDLWEAMDDLFHWLVRGGFSPKLSGEHYISIGNGENVSYSILFKKPNFHEFIRYVDDRRTCRYLLEGD